VTVEGTDLSQGGRDNWAELGAGFSNLARQLRARKAPGRRQEGNCGNDMATMTYDDMHETTFFLEATPLSGIPLESS
jgi:hypothetical protein